MGMYDEAQREASMVPRYADNPVYGVTQEQDQTAHAKAATELAEGLERLERCLHDLGTRIEPVLIPLGPDKSSMPLSEPRTSASTATDFLRARSDHIDMLIQLVQNLAARVDL